MSEWLRNKFSWSKLSTYSQCPRKAFFRYVMGMKEPPSEALLFGRAAHTGQEEDNKEKTRGRVMSLTQVLDAAVADYEREGQNVDEFAQAHRTQLEVYEKSGERARVNPVKDTVEATFQMEVAVTADPDAEPQEPALLEGFVDCISQDPETGEQTVVDYKAVGRPYSQKDSDKSLQAALYDVANDVPRHRFVSFVKPGKQYATTKVVESELTQSRLTKLLHFLAATIAGFRKSLKTGDFPQCDPSCHWCSESSCPFYQQCYPEKCSQLPRFISIGEVKKAGTLPPPEWRKNR